MKGGDFRKVLKGGALFTGGTLAATALQFVAGIIVIRIVERNEYGLISLGTTGVTILTILSLLGFKTAVPRFLAKYRAQGSHAVADKVAGTALLSAAALSTIFAVAIYWQASLVAQLFNKPGLAMVLEVLAAMLPAMVMIETLSTVFQGIEDARAKVLFQDLALNFFRLAFLAPVAIAGLGFDSILWVYVASAWTTLILYAIYALRVMRGTFRPRLSWSVARDLIWFSFPLLGVSIMANVMTWVAVLSLGYMQTASELGRFSAPMRLATVIPIPLVGMNFLFLPVVTKIVEQGSRQQVMELYRSTTKWSFLVTLPLLAYFIIDAQFVVTLLLGDAYQDSENILRVLAVGFAVNAFTGPNSATLVAYGDTRTPFMVAMMAAVIAVLLCLVLIPNYGALGAAFGTSVARASSNLLLSAVLFIRFRIHPFTDAYLKPLVFVSLSAAVLWLFVRHVPAENIVLHVLPLLCIGLLTVFSPLLTRTLTRSDLDMLQTIELRVLGTSRLVNKLENRLLVEHQAGGIDGKP